MLRRGASDLAAENMRLRRELVNAKLDLDIGKKGSDVFCEGVAMKCAWIEAQRDEFSVTNMGARLEASWPGQVMSQHRWLPIS